MELEFLNTIMPYLKEAKSIEIVFGLIMLFLWYSVRDLKKIVTNGLSTKVTSTSEAVARIEGYLESLKESHKKNHE